VSGRENYHYEPNWDGHHATAEMSTASRLSTSAQPCTPNVWQVGNARRFAPATRTPTVASELREASELPACRAACMSASAASEPGGSDVEQELL